MEGLLPSPGTHVALLVRIQGWFRAHGELDDLPPFPKNQIDAVSIGADTPRLKVLVGRGPLEHSLPSAPVLWVGHGEEKTPLFTSPGTGPVGAALYARSDSRIVSFTDNEAATIVELSHVIGVGPQFSEQYSNESSPDAHTPQGGPAHKHVSDIHRVASDLLGLAVGAYTLYLFPVVWQPVARTSLVSGIDLEKKTASNSTTIPVDTLIPFRLKVSHRLEQGSLRDAVVRTGQVARTDLTTALCVLRTIGRRGGLCGLSTFSLLLSEVLVPLGCFL